MVGLGADGLGADGLGLDDLGGGGFGFAAGLPAALEQRFRAALLGLRDLLLQVGGEGGEGRHGGWEVGGWACVAAGAGIAGTCAAQGHHAYCRLPAQPPRPRSSHRLACLMGRTQHQLLLLRLLPSSPPCAAGG